MLFFLQSIFDIKYYTFGDLGDESKLKIPKKIHSFEYWCSTKATVDIPLKSRVSVLHSSLRTQNLGAHSRWGKNDAFKLKILQILTIIYYKLKQLKNYD